MRRQVGQVSTPRVYPAYLPFFWASLDGSATAALRDSFNVSSITDNGTGDITVTFLIPATNANYAVASGVIGMGAYVAGAALVCATGGAATTSVRLEMVNTDVGTVDTTYIWVAGVGH